MKQYNPGNTNLVLFGFPISGFMDGTFIELEPEGDAFTDHCGADGEVNRVGSSDYRATLRFTLKQTSDSNDILSSLHVADRATGAGVGPMLLKDGDGRSLAAGAQCWISKPPTVGYADETQGREWTVRIAKLINHVGGN